MDRTLDMTSDARQMAGNYVMARGNVLSRICRSIGRYVKRFADTFIYAIIMHEIYWSNSIK